MSSGKTVSHVVEYFCQYTDQLRKKHKVWHDGKLKYYTLTNKFQLYTEEGGTLLGSEFVTNSRQLAHILDERGFGAEEHHIFAAFLIIIAELDRAYDKEISLFRPGHTPRALPGPVVSLAHRRAPSSPSGSQQSRARALPHARHSLSLAKNEPFRRPRQAARQRSRSPAAREPARSASQPTPRAAPLATLPAAAHASQPAGLALATRIPPRKRTIVHSPITL
ncbi:ACL194Cp [Eremothecium gossypii ATCC 10895]|uniref:ACL194Cp n=1 Tax=Eremothecium gossypii (strain ATCC 10895 / CBS 109.51 / FGSC 9923 / NRRL Y-1056) TaxID=284811 RepID=Q75CW0_EREGS|nr:ACL194Cp [Eremothecium gossypii ATCC 10895]AAS51034.2 ACL194Cp [Eremothecium gossypii ATCC 10895]AEY95324.1 FACL194Cp [Eremothecium gossypii FDAG1]